MTDFVLTPDTLELTLQAVSPDAVAQNIGLNAPLLKAIGPDGFDDCEYLITIHPAIYREQRLTHEMSPNAQRRYREFLRAIDATLCEIRNLISDLFLLIQPYEAPYPVLPFLSPIVGVDFNYDVPEDAARKEIANAIFLWERKGTRDNISDWIGFITGFASRQREFYKEVLRTNVYNQSYAVTPSTIKNRGGKNYATMPHLSETHLTNTWAGDENTLPFYNFYSGLNDTYGVHGFTQYPGEQEGFFHYARYTEGWGDFEPQPGTERRIESTVVGELAPGFLFRNHVGLFLDVPDEQLEETWFGEPIFLLFLDKIKRILDLICFYGVVKHVVWRLITEDDAGLCEDITFSVVPRFAEGWNDIEPLGSPFTQTEAISCEGVGEECADCIGETWGLTINGSCIQRLADFVLCTNDPNKVTNDSDSDSNGGPGLTWFYATYWSEQAGRYPTTIPTMGTPGESTTGDILQTWTPTYLSTFTSEVVIPSEVTAAEEFIGPLIGTSNGQGEETLETMSQYVLDVCESGVFEDNILNFIEEWNSPFLDTEILADDWDIPEVFEDNIELFDDWDVPETEDTEIHTDSWDIEDSFLDMFEIIDNWNISDIFDDEEIFCDNWEPTIPLTLAGPGLWLDGSKGPKANSPVGIWLDRFTDPGGNDAVQATLANQPDLDASDSDFNDFGAVTFDGTNDYMSVFDDASLNGDQFTAFMVMEWTTPGFNDTLVSKSTDQTFSDGWGLISRGANTLRFYVDDINSNFTDVTIPNGTPVIVCVNYDQTRLELVVDGQFIAADLYGAGITNSVKDLILGAHNTSTGFSGFFDGTIAEFIYYNRDLTLSEKQTIITYLSDKYDIAVDFATEIVSEDWDFTDAYDETAEVSESFDFDVVYVETPEAADEFDFDQAYNDDIEVEEPWEEFNLPETPVLLVDEDWDVEPPDTPVLVAFDDFDDDIENVIETWDISQTYDETEEVAETFDFAAAYDETTEAEDPFDFDIVYDEETHVYETWTDDILEFGPETWTPNVYVVDSTSFQFVEDWESTVFVVDSSSFQFTEDWTPTVFSADSASFDFFEDWDATYVGVLEFGVEIWNSPYIVDSTSFQFFEDWNGTTFIVDSTSFQFTEEWEPFELEFFEDWES